MKGLGRRKRVRRYDVPGHSHFLTFSCFHRLPLLSKDRTRHWLLQALERARLKHDLELWAWGIMPEHVHLLVYPTRRAYRLASVLADIKRPVAQQAIQFLRDAKSEFLERLTVRNKTRTYHRFWQAGGGYDENVDDEAAVHAMIDYIHANPVRRGLAARAEDWPWSSARSWLQRSQTADGPAGRNVPTLVEVPSRA